MLMSARCALALQSRRAVLTRSALKAVHCAISICREQQSDTLAMNRTKVIWIIAVLLLGIDCLGTVHSELTCEPGTHMNTAQIQGSSNNNNRNYSTIAVAQVLALEANVARPCSDKCFIDYTLLLNTEAGGSRSIQQPITNGYNMLSLQHTAQQQHTTVPEASYPPAAASVVVACYDPSCTATPSSFAILQNQFITIAVQAPTLHQLTAAQAAGPPDVWFYGFDDLSGDPDSMPIEIIYEPMPNLDNVQTDNLHVSLDHQTPEASKPAYNHTDNENPATTKAQQTGKVGECEPVAPTCYTNSIVFLWGTRAMLVAWLGAVEYARRQWGLKASSETASRS